MSGAHVPHRIDDPDDHRSHRFLRGTCGDLAAAARVEVRGVPRGGGVTATVVKFEDAGQEDASARGTVSNVRGTCPGIQFTAGAKTIVTTGATQFVGGTYAQIASGVRVEVEGTARGSTITAARKVQFEDAAEAEVEVEGTVSAFTGACPTLTFTLQGRTVRTTSATEFRDGACGGLADGARVNARGTLQSDGSLHATRVTTR